MSSWLLVVFAALLTSVLVFLALGIFFKLRVQPYLDAKVEEFKKISEQMEENIRRGVKSGVNESFRELPTHTVKETTRSVVKMGSGLVEGGLSSLFGEKGKEKQ